MLQKSMHAVEEATVPRIKLFSESSLNDHTGSYITVLVEGGGGITTAAEGAGNEPDTDKPASRRNNTSLQGTATTAAAARDAGEGGDVTMRVMLPQLIDTAVSVSNLAFLTVMEAAAAPQRHLITRKHQNKSFIVF
ncbi:hypothetical protein BDBG_17253 [Blastomyces gilchristii SLH14081]|uniref:Uncharacterized protein n=1 Tax=Blastomyces gilchristii (strain SLH14081) TaxID=559298 RepID=A0A179UNP8_BLAGS|nr:uncharacterized protein BDBG_17253 [Blastomyces gilchristii SLH14081]OAT09604.1 hypothetical protein BDBG_17253 [Blastomyces gilchristii SLH14081]